MNREQLIALLSSLMTRRLISATEMAIVVNLFDRGDIGPEQLPLPPNVAAAPATLDNNAAYAAILLLMGIRQTPTTRLSKRRRERLRELLRERFEQITNTNARELVDGNVSLQRWHELEKGTITNHTARQYAAGVGEPTDVQSAIRPAMTEQYAYLYRFAGEVAISLILGKALRYRGLRSRAQLYGGTGWEYWHRGNESVTQPGEIIVFQSRDDPSTCRPCLDAQTNGPYLPGEGPYPGPSTCLGLGSCRCVRRVEYNPREWERLTGRTLPQQSNIRRRQLNRTT